VTGGELAAGADDVLAGGVLAGAGGGAGAVTVIVAGADDVAGCGDGCGAGTVAGAIDVTACREGGCALLPVPGTRETQPPERLWHVAAGMMLPRWCGTSAAPGTVPPGCTDPEGLPVPGPVPAAFQAVIPPTPANSRNASTPAQSPQPPAGRHLSRQFINLPRDLAGCYRFVSGTA
jgi:hypothetical protein